MSLEGKVAIVTGAGSGIGECVAHTLATRGAKVMVADIDAPAASAVATAIAGAGGVAESYEVDISSEPAVKGLIEHTVNRFGGLDVLHNNAADTRAEVIGRDGQVADVDVEVWDQTMAVNLRGTMLGCKHAIPRLLARGGGVIVNTSSNSGLLGDLARTAYGASKAAINALTMYVATQYGRQGIRCNAVSPGLVMTPAADRNLSQVERDILRDNHLSQRFCAPQDVANVVAFLASEESAYINGQVLCADGGQFAHTPTYAQFVALSS